MLRRALQLGMIVLIAVAVDWSSKHLIFDAIGFEPAVKNRTPTQVWVLAPLALASLAAVWMLRGRIALAGAGLLCGGIAANQLDRALFGPVHDYFPRPDTYPTIYFNLADAMIASGWLLLVAALIGAVWSSFAAEPVEEAPPEPGSIAEAAAIAARLFPDDPSPSILPSAEGSIRFDSDPGPTPWAEVVERLDAWRSEQ